MAEITSLQAYPWPQRRVDWDLLVPGAAISVIKQHDDGSDVVRYPGVVISASPTERWVEVEAVWTAGTVRQGPLTFEVGDILREFFSCEVPGNAFSLFTPTMEHKGWYANVTWPSWVEVRDGEPCLIWRDLILDFVAAGDRIPFDLDDDELDASGLELSSPALYEAIVRARKDLQRALADGDMPFVVPATPTT